MMPSKARREVVGTSFYRIPDIIQYQSKGSDMSQFVKRSLLIGGGAGLALGMAIVTGMERMINGK